jgi:hypothetical protein
VEKTPVEKTPVEKTPVEKNPVEKNPVERNPERNAVERNPVESPLPLLIWEKRGPAELKVGQPSRFEIIVRNVGRAPAADVRVELRGGQRFTCG